VCEPLVGGSGTPAPARVRPAPLRPLGSELGCVATAPGQLEADGKVNPVRGDARVVGRWVRATQICYAGYCNLVEMENKRSDSGDSGGPWFYNYTAYGVHHGWFWDPFPIQRNLFSKALSVFNALDVQIKR
jgi:hypothetical protein